jgi:acid phosphatase type 7
LAADVPFFAYFPSAIMSLDRRSFLLGTLGTAAATSIWSPAFAEDSEKSKFDLDTLFLTWQRDPTTTVTVQWVEKDKSVDARTITYRAKGDRVWQSIAPRKKPYPKTQDHFAYRAELTGLTPGTEYQFQIGKHTTEYRFRTMPAKLTDAFQFVSGGDCGINHNTIATNILAAKQDPMFALIGGDLGYDNGKDAAVSLAYLKNYRKHMVDSKGRLIPMLVCIGNHEVNGGYNQPRKNGPFFFAMFDALFAEQTYATLDFGDYLSLVLLDTGHVAKVGGEQTAWLDEVLAERTERPHLIVANHVPAYPSHREYDSENKKGGGAGNRKHWCPLFEKHNVDFVLEHHDHTFKRSYPMKGGLVDKNGLLYLGDGSWGRLRPPIPLEKRSYLAAVNMSYHVTVHRLENDRRFHMALSDGGKIVDVCMTQKRPQRAMGRGAPT